MLQDAKVTDQGGVKGMVGLTAPLEGRHNAQQDVGGPKTASTWASLAPSSMLSTHLVSPGTCAAENSCLGCVSLLVAADPFQE
jgi:hypothetical protein